MALMGHGRAVYGAFRNGEQFRFSSHIQGIPKTRTNDAILEAWLCSSHGGCYQDG